MPIVRMRMIGADGDVSTNLEPVLSEVVTLVVQNISWVVAGDGRYGMGRDFIGCIRNDWRPLKSDTNWPKRDVGLRSDPPSIVSAILARSHFRKSPSVFPKIGCSPAAEFRSVTSRKVAGKRRRFLPPATRAVRLAGLPIGWMRRSQTDH